MDLDELIVPRHVDDLTWDDMIHRSNCPDDTASYGARQFSFSLTYPANNKSQELQLLDNTQHFHLIMEYPSRGKYIAQSGLVLS